MSKRAQHTLTWRESEEQQYDDLEQVCQLLELDRNTLIKFLLQVHLERDVLLRDPEVFREQYNFPHSYTGYIPPKST